LVYIHLETTALNQARVSQRVSEGGHHVPSDKVISRIPRVIKNIKQALPLCDFSYLLDNSRLDNPFQQIAVIHNGQMSVIKKPMPTWTTELIANFLDKGYLD